MITLLLAVLALGADGDQAAHINLARLPLADAEKLDGKIVGVWIEVGKPVVTTDGGRTLIGCEDRDDGHERVVILQGERLDVDVGQRLVVVGRLRVLLHPAATVGGVRVPEWIEMRVVE